MTLLAIYVGSLAFGGILIGASLLGADRDGDADADHGDLDHGDVAHGDLDHGDVDHGDLGHGEAELGDHDGEVGEAHGDHGGTHHEIGAGTRISVTTEDATVGATGVLVANLLSLRFWTFALASFGLTGLLLSLVGLPELVGLGISAPLGLGIGWGAATVVRSLARDTRSTEMRTQTLQGREAVVVLAVGPEKVGKVRLVHAGQTLELPATTREDRLLDRAETVLVVEVKGGQAVVTSAVPERTRVLRRDTSHRT